MRSHNKVYAAGDAPLLLDVVQQPGVTCEAVAAAAARDDGDAGDADGATALHLICANERATPALLRAVAAALPEASVRARTTASHPKLGGIGGAEERVGGVRAFLGEKHGYGAGGWALLACSCTVFLPAVAPWALARCCAGVCGGDASWTNPERLLATPDPSRDADEMPAPPCGHMSRGSSCN